MELGIFQFFVQQKNTTLLLRLQFHYPVIFNFNSKRYILQSRNVTVVSSSINLHSCLINATILIELIENVPWTNFNRESPIDLIINNKNASAKLKKMLHSN